MRLKVSVSILMLMMIQVGRGMLCTENDINDFKGSVRILVGTNDDQTSDGTIWKFIRGLGSYNNETGAKALQELLNKNNLPLLVTTKFFWKTLKRAVDGEYYEDQKAAVVHNILLQEYSSFIGSNNDNTSEGTLWKFIRGLESYNEETGSKALLTLLEKNNLIMPITKEFSWKTLKQAVEEQSSETAKLSVISKALQERYDFLLGTNTQDTAEGTIWKFIRGLGDYFELTGAMALKSVLNRCQVRIPVSKKFSWRTLKRDVDRQYLEDYKASVVYDTLVREYYENQAKKTNSTKVGIGKSDYDIWFKASKSGDIRKMVSLIEKGIDVNCTDETHKTALLYLAENGNNRIIRQLLDEKGNTLQLLFFRKNREKVKDSDLKLFIPHNKFIASREVLVNASEYCSTDIVQLLLANGANPNYWALNSASRSWKWNTVDLLVGKWKYSNFGELFNSVVKKDVNKVKQLIYKGININAYILWGAALGGNKEIMELILDKIDNPDLDKILEQSALYGRIEIINLLLDRGVNLSNLEVLEQFAKHGCLKELELLLTKGANPNLRSNKKAISSAAEHGYKKVVELLIKNGANSESQKAALISSARGGHIEIVELLLNNLESSIIKEKALNEASSKGCTDVVRLLLERGVQPTSEALLEASKHGYLEVVKMLSSKGQHIDRRKALLVAAEGGYKDIVNLLINNGVKPNSKAIEYAANGGHVELIKLFIDLGVKPNSYALQNAVIKGHIDVVELLLDKGIDPELEDIGYVSAFNRAIESDQIEVANLLLERVYNHVFSIDIDRRLQMSLMYASDYGNLEIVKLLLNYGVNPNLTSALCEAVKHGYIEIVKLLIERGANPNGNSGEDNTLLAAVANNRQDILELLVNKGANIESYNIIGDTALSYAVKCGYMSQIEWLLNKGAKINDLVERRALERCNPDIIKLLLNRGMNPHVRDVWGRSMIDVARSWRCGEYIIKMLEEA